MTITVDDLRASLRQTEACILDADADTLLIAVRVPRNTIAANHHLLTALSEAGVAWRGTPQAVEAVETKSGVIRRSLASLYSVLPQIAGMGVIASAIACVAMAAVAGFRPPAMEVKDRMVETPMVRQGGQLRLAAMVRRNRPCEYHAMRLIRDDTGVVVWRDSVRVPPITMSGGQWTKAEVSIPLPADLGPGYYHYEAESTLVCNGGPEVVSLDPLPFEIIAK